jgi:hypothetical protein
LLAKLIRGAARRQGSFYHKADLGLEKKIKRVGASVHFGFYPFQRRSLKIGRVENYQSGIFCSQSLPSGMGSLTKVIVFPPEKLASPRVSPFPEIEPNVKKGPP